jgi:hypothetical protein
VKRQIIICVTNIKLVQGILEFFVINSDWHVLEMLGKC